MAKHSTGVSSLGEDLDETYFPLNGFVHPPLDDRIKDSYETVVKTLGPITYVPFEFQYQVPDDAFLKQTETRLEGTFRVLRADGNQITPANKVSIVNLSSAALFELIEVKINDCQCSDVSRKIYPYKSHVTCELSHSENVKRNNLYPSLYLFEDQVGVNNTDLEGENGNKSAIERRKWIAGSKNVKFSTKLYLDIFHTQKYIPPSSKLYLKLIKSSDEFVLMREAGDTTNYKIEINSLKLVLKILKPHDKYLALHRELIQKQDYVIPLTNTIVKTFIGKSGDPSIHLTNLNTEKYLPRSVIVCFVDRAAFNSSYASNPFVYNNKKLSRMELKLDSGKVIKLQRDNESFQFEENSTSGIEAYMSMLQNSGFLSNHEDNGISFKKFCSDSFFLVFNLTDPCSCNGYYKHSAKTGDFEIFIDFQDTLNNDIEILVFNIYEAVLCTDNKNKSLFYNYPIPPKKTLADK